MRRGEIWWAALPVSRGSEPGFRRPVVVVQADSFNQSRIQTLIVAVMTTNLKLAAVPGNVRLDRAEGGLQEESVVNVSQLLTIDKGYLDERLGSLSVARMAAIDDGLRLVLSL